MKRSNFTILASAAVGLLAVGIAWLAWPKVKDLNAPGKSSEVHKDATIRGHQTNQTDSLRRWRGLTDDRLPWQRRVELVKELDHPVSPELVDFLFAELRRVAPAENENSQWIVQNEILNALREKGLAPDRLTSELIKIIYDPSLTVVQRDYAVQNLTQWISPLSPESPREEDEGRREQGVDALTAAVTDPKVGQGTVSGTALHCLCDLSNRISKEQADRIWIDLTPTVMKMIAGDIAVGSGHRVTAVQVAGMRKLDSCYPAIRSMAVEHASAQDPTLALSAIAALGAYGRNEDRAFLTQLTESNSRYRFAATEALRKLPSAP